MATRGRQIFPPGTSVLQAVQEAVKNLTITPADTAAVQLAAEYAQAIDASLPPDERQETLDKLGPKLLAVLDALGATPTARAKATKATSPGHPAPRNLDKIRGARRRKA